MHYLYFSYKFRCNNSVEHDNSILNSIGIKTLYIHGIALEGNKTYEQIEIFHSWTAAFINAKWNLDYLREFQQVIFF